MSSVVCNYLVVDYLSRVACLDHGGGSTTVILLQLASHEFWYKLHEIIRCEVSMSIERVGELGMTLCRQQRQQGQRR